MIEIDDYDTAAAGTIFSPFALETMGGASTKAIYYLFIKHLRDSGVPLGEALKRKLKKDILFALRRGTIAQVTTLALDGRARPARRRGRAPCR